jgi:hypothetical protein
MEKTKSIHQYVKDKNGNLIGCVAATGRYHIGWSKCNTKSGDTFDKKRALQIALNRAALALVRPEIHAKVPHQLSAVYDHFAMDRAVRYFKENDGLTRTV